jgi:isoquinoline 1-oxidoreductase beta subunit
MDQLVNKKSSFAPSRRDFLITGGVTGLVVGFSLGATREANAGTSARVSAYVQIDSLSNITVFVGQSEMGQGIMTGLAQLVAEELQLDPLKWASQVTVEQGLIDSTMTPGAKTAPFSKPSGYTSQSTGGSTSMRAWYKPMRQAAAIARDALLSAFTTWKGVPSPTVVNGVISNAATYGEVVAWATDPANNYTMSLPTSASLYSGPYKFIGSDVTGTTPIRRSDIPAKVLGKAVFGIDVRMAGMVHATVLHSPTIGGTLTTLPSSPPGIKLFLLKNEAGQQNAVGVVDVSVTSNTWSAMEAAKKLGPQWTPNYSVDSATIDGAAGIVNAAVSSTTGLINVGSPQYVKCSGGYFTDTPPTGATPTGRLSDSGNGANLQSCVSALSDSSITPYSIDVAYYLPFLAHAPMEVMNCTVWVQAATKTCEIWAPTQSQTACIKTAQKVLGADYKVTVHTTYLGGGLGRKIEQDFVLQALQIGAGLGTPVKVTWSRPEDFKNDRYRPSALIRVRAGLDSNKKLSALVYRNVSTSISIQKTAIANAANGTNNIASDDAGGLSGALEGAPAAPPYAVPNWRAEFVPNNSVALPPLGYWRSVGESYNTFAMECAIDELATKAGIPSDFKTLTNTASFRKSLLDSAASDYARCTGVIDAVVNMANGVGLPTGSARGIAFMKGFGSIVAVIAEVSLNAATNNVKLNKIFCAIDCGLPINKDAIRAQLEGGLLHGVSAALYGKVTFKSGAPYNGDGTKPLTNFDKSPVVKLANMPAMSIQIRDVIPRTAGTELIGGVGEVGVPCVAPAIANAFAALTGRRVRAMPFYPGATMGGL